MAGSPEDLRAAAQLKVSLSSFVITAALAVLAAQGVIVNSVLEKASNSAAFFVISIFAAVCLVFSVICGGKGVQCIITNGENGEWSKRIGSHFNTQAISVLFGTILVIVSVFFTQPKVCDGSAPYVDPHGCPATPEGL